MAKNHESHVAAARQQPERKSHKLYLDHLSIHEGEKGGHIVTHHMRSEAEPYGGAEEQHVFGAEQGSKVIEHLKKHLNIAEPTSDDLKDEDDH